jgi:CBS domain-containing protein
MTNEQNSAPDLPRVRVSDWMHTGILSCTPDAPLAEVAGIMSEHRVHAVAAALTPETEHAR